MKFCTGNTSDSAVIALSLILATNRLSTMLYSEFTSIEITIGSAIESSSGSTGFSFIKVLSILPPTRKIAQKNHTAYAVWRKGERVRKNPHLNFTSLIITYNTEVVNCEKYTNIPAGVLRGYAYRFSSIHFARLLMNFLRYSTWSR